MSLDPINNTLKGCTSLEGRTEEDGRVLFECGHDEHDKVIIRVDDQKLGPYSVDDDDEFTVEV